MIVHPPSPPLFPYTTLFRSRDVSRIALDHGHVEPGQAKRLRVDAGEAELELLGPPRSEEHTSELQSPMYLVCRLLLEKKKQESMRALQTTSLRLQDINDTAY